jgi:hypothetical protein
MVRFGKDGTEPESTDGTAGSGEHSYSSFKYSLMDVGVGEASAPAVPTKYRNEA